MHLTFEFADRALTVRLDDSLSAQELVSQLPLDLTIDDYSTNEKIAHLPRRLTDNGSKAFANERRGDLCYFAPWGNLAFFYEGYRWSRGLVRLGRVESGFEALLIRGNYPLRVQRALSSTSAG